MAEVVSIEVATAEVDRWLDSKKVSEKKREDKSDNIETMIDSIVDGTLEIKEDNTIVHNLKFEVGAEVKIQKLEYRPRLAPKSVIPHLQGIKGSDFDGRIIAFAAALTGKSKEIIKALDYEDFSITQTIALFFI